MEPMTIENAIHSMTEIQARHEAAIRDLASELRQSREAQREAQRATDEKLHILIETVDRIIRNQKS